MASKARHGPDEEMGAAEGSKRVRKPGQANASGRVHDEEEHEGNLKFEVSATRARRRAAFAWCGKTWAQRVQNRTCGAFNTRK